MANYCKNRYKHPCFLRPIYAKSFVHIEYYNVHGKANDYHENRVVARAYNGIFELTEHWYKDMDYERKLHGHNNKRTGFSAIITPHPDDNATPEQVLEVANKWVQHFFGDGWDKAGVCGCFQSVIEVHDDSHERIKQGKKGIVHAHITINCSNQIYDNGYHKIQIPHQVYKYDTVEYKNRLFKEMGWRYFEDWDENGEMLPFDERENVCQLEKQHKQNKKRRQTPPEKIDKASQRLLETNKYSWKEDIRARVKMASYLSNSPKQFIAILESEKFGIHVTKSANGKDLIYSLKDTPSRKVSGRKLGNNYTPWGIKRIHKVNQNRAITISEKSYRHFIPANSNVIAFYDSDKNKLSDVAAVYQKIQQYNLHSISQIDKLLVITGENKAYTRLYNELDSIRKDVIKFNMLPDTDETTDNLNLQSIINENATLDERMNADPERLERTFNEFMDRVRKDYQNKNRQKQSPFINNQNRDNARVDTQQKDKNKNDKER